ncbi:MAG: UDP-2,3-diacylglucosamine diphosphatase [Pseudomonadota bacterium]
MSTAPHAAELAAPASWRTIDFISDLHLEASDAATFAAWSRYMQETPADAVFILGDLFEVWVGDDAVHHSAFLADCAHVLRQCATHAAVYFMHGNRDFLVGRTFLGESSTALLADPTVLSFAGDRWLLSHGDALCLADVDYLRFREQVRSPQWQQAFLARPLAEREATGRALRKQSEERKRSGEPYADVDTAAASDWLSAANAATLIHGHTHRPADHSLPGGRTRTVLSDWDAKVAPPRMEVLRLSCDGLQRLVLS